MDKRGSDILLRITPLPSAYGITDLGPETYAIVSKNHINLRLDFAWGKGSKGLYFSVGEAF